MTSPHLSALALDEAAAGIPSPTQTEHLNACADCSAKVAQRVASASALRTTPEAERRKLLLREAAQRIERSAASEEQKSPWWSLPPWMKYGVAFASLVVVVGVGLRVTQTSPTPAGEEVRLKGAATVELVDARGSRVGEAKVGDAVRLRVGGAGAKFAAVLSVDEAGNVEVVWPKDSDVTRAVAPGAAVPLGEAFEVTPGSFALHAFFTDAPEALKPAMAALRESAAQEKSAGRRALDAPTPKLGTAQAKMILTVQP